MKIKFSLLILSIALAFSFSGCVRRVQVHGGLGHSGYIYVPSRTTHVVRTRTYDDRDTYNSRNVRGNTTVIKKTVRKTRDGRIIHTTTNKVRTNRNVKNNKHRYSKTKTRTKSKTRTRTKGKTVNKTVKTRSGNIYR